MWKVCQNSSTGELSLVHYGYNIPVGCVEITTTSNPNYINDLYRGIVESFGFKYDSSVPLFKYFLFKVDEIADEVYTFAVSSPAKLQEYNQAEEDALAFIADPNVRKPFVVSWADAKGWSDIDAAKDILRTAAMFKQALLFIRTQRLSTKEKIKLYTDNIDQMKILLEAYKNKMMTLKAQLAS